MIGIYKITSPTDRVYIGQSWDIKKRWEYYTYPTCKTQKRLYRSLIKHGPKSHTFNVVHELPGDIDQNTLDVYEDFYISMHKDAGLELMNIKGGGRGGRHSEESKIKISNTLTGIKRSDNFRRITSDRMKGQVWTDESKQKLSHSKKGGPSHMKGKSHTEEAKGKIRNKRALQVITEATRQKISLSNKGKGAKEIIQYSMDSVFIKSWPMIRAAAIELGISEDGIGNAIRGVANSAGGFIWKYKPEQQ